MFQEISELRLAQADGGLPTVVAAGSAPGESGVFVFSPRFHGGAHVSATPRLHHICFLLTPCAHVYSRIADQALSYEPPRGSLAICPAGADYTADGHGSAEAIEAIIVAIDPGQFALAAAEGSAFEAKCVIFQVGCRLRLAHFRTGLFPCLEKSLSNAQITASPPCCASRAVVRQGFALSIRAGECRRTDGRCRQAARETLK